MGTAGKEIGLGGNVELSVTIDGHVVNLIKVSLRLWENKSENFTPM